MATFELLPSVSHMYVDPDVDRVCSLGMFPSPFDHQSAPHEQSLSPLSCEYGLSPELVGHPATHNHDFADYSFTDLSAPTPNPATSPSAADGPLPPLEDFAFTHHHQLHTSETDPSSIPCTVSPQQQMVSIQHQQTFDHSHQEHQQPQSEPSASAPQQQQQTPAQDLTPPRGRFARPSPPPPLVTNAAPLPLPGLPTPTASPCPSPVLFRTDLDSHRPSTFRRSSVGATSIPPRSLSIRPRSLSMSGPTSSSFCGPLSAPPLSTAPWTPWSGPTDTIYEHPYETEQPHSAHPYTEPPHSAHPYTHPFGCSSFCDSPTCFHPTSYFTTFPHSAGPHPTEHQYGMIPATPDTLFSGSAAVAADGVSVMLPPFGLPSSQPQHQTIADHSAAAGSSDFVSLSAPASPPLSPDAQVLAASAGTSIIPPPQSNQVPHHHQIPAFQAEQRTDSNTRPSKQQQRKSVALSINTSINIGKPILSHPSPSINSPASPLTPLHSANPDNESGSFNLGESADFPDPETVQAALQAAANGAKIFTCTFPACGRVFNRLQNLKSHWRCHSGARPYGCEECGAKFRRLPDLYRHRRSLHSAGKPHSCHRCGKKFARADALRRHLTSKSRHSGCANKDFDGVVNPIVAETETNKPSSKKARKITTTLEPQMTPSTQPPTTTFVTLPSIPLDVPSSFIAPPAPIQV
ncbi:hypothetical protein HK102_001322 [Quaeritorhiza haematococci]|nr:hypothetical protein HK102_001322 [Quaeritorhiza haematococci]